MKEILTLFWSKKLLPVINKNPDYKYFLTDKNLFPSPENRFNAINNIDLKSDYQVVIFGQDPYPRKESATGFAFWDGKIKTWDDKFSPSFRNIIKSVLISKNLATKETKIKELREILKNSDLKNPDDFFINTIKQNIVWLNASLTFESKDNKTLNKHLKFWEPVIQEVISVLLEETKFVIFVFWGGKSLKFKKHIENSQNTNYQILTNCHPMLEKFHQKNTFSQINKVLKEKLNKEIRF